MASGSLTPLTPDPPETSRQPSPNLRRSTCACSYPACSALRRSTRWPVASTVSSRPTLSAAPSAGWWVWRPSPYPHSSSLVFLKVWDGPERKQFLDVWQTELHNQSEPGTLGWKWTVQPKTWHLLVFLTRFHSVGLMDLRHPHHWTEHHVQLIHSAVRSYFGLNCPFTIIRHLSTSDMRIKRHCWLVINVQQTLFLTTGLRFYWLEKFGFNLKPEHVSESQTETHVLVFLLLNVRNIWVVGLKEKILTSSNRTILVGLCPCSGRVGRLHPETGQERRRRCQVRSRTFCVYLHEYVAFPAFFISKLTRVHLFLSSHRNFWVMLKFVK